MSTTTHEEDAIDRAERIITYTHYWFKCPHCGDESVRQSHDDFEEVCHVSECAQWVHGVHIDFIGYWVGMPMYYGPIYLPTDTHDDIPF